MVRLRWQAVFVEAAAQRVEANQPAQPGTINLDMDGQGTGRGYSYHIEHQPAFSLAVLTLQPEQSIMAEAGAMVSMSANVELQSQMKGGLLGALKRAAGGESAFVSTFTARGGPGEVTLAPGAPGDIAAIELQQSIVLCAVEFLSRGRRESDMSIQNGAARNPSSAAKACSS